MHKVGIDKTQIGTTRIRSNCDYVCRGLAPCHNDERGELHDEGKLFQFFAHRL